MNKRLRIKVCGMTLPMNIEGVAALRPDYMGFIFYEPSPRFARRKLDSQILTRLPDKIRKTGVFVNETYENIRQTAQQYGLDTIQLHGTEPPALLKRLQDNGYEILKAISIEQTTDFEQLTAYEGLAHCFVLDTKTPAYGGSGKTFDWNILQDYPSPTPFLLSGGIGLQHARQIKNLNIEQMIGIDVNSRFEFSPGVKNVDALSRLFTIIR